jgi:hypothetical protein
MIELHAEVEITASAERVWRELTAFTSYPKWTRSHLGSAAADLGSVNPSRFVSSPREPGLSPCGSRLLTSSPTTSCAGGDTCWHRE